LRDSLPTLIPTAPKLVADQILDLVSVGRTNSGIITAADIYATDPPLHGERVRSSPPPVKFTTRMIDNPELDLNDFKKLV